MIVRGVGRALVGLALVLAVSACDDNPLAEDREDASHFRLNPSNVAVHGGGGTVKVDATVLNKYGAATNAAVSATPCDARITAVADTARTAYEFPERFEITGVTLGVSCLVVSGGGITDTIGVRVIPDSIAVSFADTIESGSGTTVEVTFLGANGQPVTGMSLSDVTITLDDEDAGILNPATGEIAARAPTDTEIEVALNPVWGAVRRTTLPFTVLPATFTGTAVQEAYSGGQAVRFTAGALPFDEDTEITFDTDWGTVVTAEPVTATEIVAMLPFGGLPAGTELGYTILTGEGVAVGGTFTTTAATPADDAYGDTFTTTPMIQVGVDAFGALGGTDEEEVLHFTVTEAGDYTMNVNWNDDSDIDTQIQSADFSETLLSRETGAHPEAGTVHLEPGIYTVWLFMYESHTGDMPITTYRVRLTQN